MRGQGKGFGVVRLLMAPETFNLGETSRLLEVAKAFGPDHEIRFLGYSRQWMPLIEDAGFDVRLLQPELDAEQVEAMYRFDQGHILAMPFSTGMLRERVAAEREQIREFHPDAVVIGTTLSQLISARAERVPLVFLKPYPYSRPSLEHWSDYPVFGSRGRRARAANRLLGRAVGAAGGAMRWLPAPFRTVSAENDAPLPEQSIRFLDAELNLITTPAELIPIRLPGDHRVVGPVYARLPDDAGPDPRELRTPGRPLIYAGLGSSGRSDLAMRLLAALAPLPITVLAPLADRVDAEAVAALGGDIHLTGLIASHRLAGVIDASIIHGGEGTVQAACLSGVPFAGIGLQLEQRMNIDACAVAGNAVRIESGDLTPERMRRVLAELQEPWRRRAAVRVSGVMHRHDGPRRAVEEILDYLR